MPKNILANAVLLPEQEFQSVHYSKAALYFKVSTRHTPEVCPRCATLSQSVYDRRRITLKDAPIRGRRVYLQVRKRRLYCKPCRKPFTEPMAGVRKGARTTQRFKAHILWACDNFTNLSQVKKSFGCSSSYLYKALYEQLELKRRTRLYPWPRVIGIDEHSFKRNKRFGCTEFASMIVDHKNKRVMEVAEGKTNASLQTQLAHIPGRENVNWVSLDLCDPFKNFAKEFFPNARLVADKFHVLRLLNPAINRRRKEITGDRRSLRIRKLLLRNGYRLDFFERSAIHGWLQNHPALREIYHWKERMHGLYRIRGYNRAKRALIAMTDEMAHSQIKEIKTLRRTLMRWKNEILNYFRFRLTNGRVEGFNNKAKLIKKQAYGYKNFKNYRLRLLHACA
jgi:transposase